MTKYVQSRLLRNCCMRERVKHPFHRVECEIRIIKCHIISNICHSSYMELVVHTRLLCPTSSSWHFWDSCNFDSLAVISFCSACAIFMSNNSSNGWNELTIKSRLCAIAFFLGFTVYCQSIFSYICIQLTVLNTKKKTISTDDFLKIVIKGEINI